ncbi:unnamed protein product, partial [marine sediment metagenome]
MKEEGLKNLKKRLANDDRKRLGKIYMSDFIENLSDAEWKEVYEFIKSCDPNPSTDNFKNMYGCGNCQKTGIKLKTCS